MEAEDESIGISLLMAAVLKQAFTDLCDHDYKIRKGASAWFSSRGAYRDYPFSLETVCQWCNRSISEQRQLAKSIELDS